MTLQYRSAVDPQRLTGSLVSAARHQGSSHAPLSSYGTPPSFREFQTKPRTQLRVMWSHGCPNWLVETDTKVFENNFPFSFLLPAKLFFKNFSFLQSSWLGKKLIQRFF